MIQYPNAASGLAKAEGLAHEKERMGRDGVDIGHDDMIEGGIGQVCGFGIDQSQTDVLKPMPGNRRSGSSEHLFREIDAQNLNVSRIEGQHESAAHADLEDSLSGLGIEDARKGLSAVVEDCAEGEVVKPGETVIGLHDGERVKAGFGHIGLQGVR
jgi:hypothetical protein